MQNDKKCFVCSTTQSLEVHHVMTAANRKLSEQYGLKVWLCHWHHNEPPNGVHFNRDLDLFLREEAQRQFEMHYPDLSFRQIFGRNYL